MTKTHMFSGGACREHVADFHFVSGHDDAIDQQLHELPFLFKSRLVQPGGDSLAEVGH